MRHKNHHRTTSSNPTFIPELKDKIDVFSKKDNCWYVGTVLHITRDSLLVHFDGWHKKHDTTIPRQKWSSLILPRGTKTQELIPEPGLTFVHEFSCTICGEGGDILCCDTCPKVFHLQCLGIDEAPLDEFKCAYCMVKLQRAAEGGKEPNSGRDNASAAAAAAHSAAASSTVAQSAAASSSSASRRMEDEHKSSRRPVREILDLSLDDDDEQDTQPTSASHATKLEKVSESNKSSSTVAASDSGDTSMDEHLARQLADDAMDDDMRHALEDAVSEPGEDGDDSDQSDNFSVDSDEPTALPSTHTMKIRHSQDHQSTTTTTAAAASTSSNDNLSRKRARPSDDSDEVMSFSSPFVIAPERCHARTCKGGFAMLFQCQGCHHSYHEKCDEVINSADAEFRLCKACIQQHLKAETNKRMSPVPSPVTLNQQASTGSIATVASTTAATPAPTTASATPSQDKPSPSKKQADSTAMTDVPTEPAPTSSPPSKAGSRKRARPNRLHDAPKPAAAALPPVPPPKPAVFPKRIMSATSTAAAAAATNTPLMSPDTEEMHREKERTMKPSAPPTLLNENIASLALYLRKIHYLFVHAASPTTSTTSTAAASSSSTTKSGASVRTDTQPTSSDSNDTVMQIVEDEEKTIPFPTTPSTSTPIITAASSTTSTVAAAASTASTSSSSRAPFPSYLHRSFCTCRHLFGDSRIYPQQQLSTEEVEECRIELEQMKDQHWNLIYKLQSDVEHLDAQWHEDVRSYYTQYNESQAKLSSAQSVAGLIHLTPEQLDQRLKGSTDLNHIKMQKMRLDLIQMEQSFEIVKKNFNEPDSFLNLFTDFADVDRCFQILLDSYSYLESGAPRISATWHRTLEKWWYTVLELQSKQSPEEVMRLEALGRSAFERAPFQPIAPPCSSNHQVHPPPSPPETLTHMCMRCQKRFHLEEDLTQHVKEHTKALKEALSNATVESAQRESVTSSTAASSAASASSTAQSSSSLASVAAEPVPALSIAEILEQYKPLTDPAIFECMKTLLNIPGVSDRFQQLIPKLTSKAAAAAAGTITPTEGAGGEDGTQEPKKKKRKMMTMSTQTDPRLIAPTLLQPPADTSLRFVLPKPVPSLPFPGIHPPLMHPQLQQTVQQLQQQSNLIQQQQFQVQQQQYQVQQQQSQLQLQLQSQQRASLQPPQSLPFVLTHGPFDPLFHATVNFQQSAPNNNNTMPAGPNPFQTKPQTVPTSLATDPHLSQQWLATQKFIEASKQLTNGVSGVNSTPGPGASTSNHNGHSLSAQTIATHLNRPPIHLAPSGPNVLNIVPTTTTTNGVTTPSSKSDPIDSTPPPSLPSSSAFLLETHGDPTYLAALHRLTDPEYVWTPERKLEFFKLTEAAKKKSFW